MAFDGMNVDTVRRIGGDLQKQADSLGSITRSVDKLIGSAQQNWSGRDLNDFVGWWREQHRPQLSGLAEALSGLATSARNNVEEQERVSGAGTVPVHTGEPGAAQPSGSAPQPNVPTVQAGGGGAEVRAGAAASFVDRWNGQRIDADGAYGAQCFDVFEKYSMEKLGTPYLVTGSDKASDLYARYDVNGLSAYYDRIPVGAPPQPGDIVVWGGGTYGHVALVTQADSSGFKVLEQNYTAPYGGTDPAAVHDKAYSGGAPILGYLRPKDGLIR